MNSDIEMSASTNQLIEPSVEGGPEARQPSRTQSPNRPISLDAPVKRPKRFLVSVISPFKNAWLDISSPGWLKSPQSRRAGCQLLSIIWISGLLCLLVYLPFGALSPLETPCQSDGDFELDGIQNTDIRSGAIYPGKIFRSSRFAYLVNRWAFQSFFEINLSWEVYDFTSAKLIDVTWDLVRDFL